MFLNEGAWDRLLRLFLGIAFWYAAGVAWSATDSVVYGAIGAIAFVTGFVGWCPAYTLFGFSTRKKVGG